MKNVYQEGYLVDIWKPAGFVVAAVRGGSGKTFVSIGLVTALKNLGYKVAPFKKGPDYIDAGWLAAAAGTPCYNLDPFLMDSKDIIDSFCGKSIGVDIALVEGNRGLFDGLDDAGSCSTAELAKLLGLPVILVVDVTKMTRTAAAVVYGCKNFDKDLNVSGVILNQIGTSRQESLIRRVVETSCGVPVVGAIPRLSRNLFPERHLGLVPTPEHKKLLEAVDYAGKVISETVDIEKILAISKGVDLCRPRNYGLGSIPLRKSDSYCEIVIGVVRDEAFQFYYPENLEALETMGARLEFFSAVRDKHLPLDIDGLYLGGGFPEVYAALLAGNESLKAELKEAIDKGMPVYAECGGLMYLSEHIKIKGNIFPMVGVFPLAIEMHEKPQGHGYVVGKVVRENPFFSLGSELKAHEFHYSKALVTDVKEKAEFIINLNKGQGIVEQFDGIMYKSCVALYGHVHALSCKEWARNFVEVAHAYRVGKSMKLGAKKKFPAVDDQKCDF